MAFDPHLLPADAETLLPGNATPLEVALSLVDARLLDLATEIIRTVQDPMLAPAQLLPWLALQRRLKIWDPGWPEAEKRAVIAGNYQVLAHAGTPQGLWAALDRLGLDVDYDEWFEYGGAPYYIRLRVGLGSVLPYTAALDAIIRRTVIEAKNRRTAIDTFHLARAAPDVGVTVAAIARCRRRILVDMPGTFPIVMPAPGPVGTIATNRARIYALCP